MYHISNKCVCAASKQIRLIHEFLVQKHHINCFLIFALQLVQTTPAVEVQAPKPAQCAKKWKSCVHDGNMTDDWLQKNLRTAPSHSASSANRQHNKEKRMDMMTHCISTETTDSNQEWKNQEEGQNPHLEVQCFIFKEVTKGAKM